MTVYGRLRYKSWDKYPYAISADDIAVHELPGKSLEDLKGIAPEATGSLTSQEFVDRLNDEVVNGARFIGTRASSLLG